MLSGGILWSNAPNYRRYVVEAIKNHMFDEDVSIILDLILPWHGLTLRRARYVSKLNGKATPARAT